MWMHPCGSLSEHIIIKLDSLWISASEPDQTPISGAVPSFRKLWKIANFENSEKYQENNYYYSTIPIECIPRRNIGDGMLMLDFN